MNTANGHKVVDILVLFILLTIPTRKKSIENIFIAKVKNKLFTEELLCEVFGIGSQVRMYVLSYKIVTLLNYTRVTFGFIRSVQQHIYITNRKF